jgi:hypothetical protein
MNMDLVLDIIEKDLNIIKLNHDQALAYYRLMWLIEQEGKQSFHVEPNESKKAKLLRQIGFTIRDLAFIFQRSTKTIHEHVQAVTPGVLNELP